MVYRRDDEGKLHDLPTKNVDTGMGFERTIAVLNGFTSIYESDLFADILKALRDRVGSTYSERGGRIAAVHIRTAVQLLSD